MEKEYTPREVAKKLGLCERTVRLYLKKKIIIGYKSSPRRWRIPEDSLFEYLEKINSKLLGGIING